MSMLATSNNAGSATRFWIFNCDILTNEAAEKPIATFKTHMGAFNALIRISDGSYRGSVEEADNVAIERRMREALNLPDVGMDVKPFNRFEAGYEQ